MGLSQRSPCSSRRTTADRTWNILSCAPTMAHVPKGINRYFRDKKRVGTLRGSDLEKRERQTRRLVSTLGRFGDPEEDD